MIHCNERGIIGLIFGICQNAWNIYAGILVIVTWFNIVKHILFSCFVSQNSVKQKQKNVRRDGIYETAMFRPFWPLNF